MAVQPFSKLRSALVQGATTALAGLPTAMENAPFEKPALAGDPWAAVFIMPNQPEAATLGADGQDAHDGIMQIDLNYQLKMGEAAVMAKADALADFFKAGERLSYSGVELTILSCGRSRGREVDGYWRVSMTVSWSARVSRV